MNPIMVPNLNIYLVYSCTNCQRLHETYPGTPTPTCCDHTRMKLLSVAKVRMSTTELNTLSYKQGREASQEDHRKELAKIVAHCRINRIRFVPIEDPEKIAPEDRRCKLCDSGTINLYTEYEQSHTVETTDGDWGYEGTEHIDIPSYTTLYQCDNNNCNQKYLIERD